MIPLDDLRPAPADRTLRSPNQNARPPGVGIRCIVLHATAGTDAGAEAWMANADADVSAHLHIRRDGSVTRMVEDHRRAWHAGRSRWGGEEDVNDFSLGWEIGNDNRGEPYTDAQYETLIRLGAFYARQGLPLHAFVSHEEIALPKGRKNDPYGFDWARFLVGVRTALKPPAPPHVVPQWPTVPRPKLEEQTAPARPVPTFTPAPRPSGWRRFVPSFLRRSSPMRAIIGRVAAAIVAMLVTFLAGSLGLEVTEETRATLTEAVTLLGLAFWGILYAIFHKLINRRLAPQDTAA